MADKALLRSDEDFGLTEAEQMALVSMTSHPGFPVLEKLLMEACKRTNEAVIKLDPTDERYEIKLRTLQQKARERNEFSLLVLTSVKWHEAVLNEIANESKPVEQGQNLILTKGGKK